MFVPGCCFSLAISSATLPLMSVELFHSAFCRVVETTYLGVLFIWSANGWSSADTIGQYDANS